ncbi:RNAse III [Plasticicumulans acidivorans]|uniref:Ribonuclease 3 n=1 Tax=Plasticicumulans acidivorans TaxID=886464 RepID=A0A317MWX2_9GAMM|nr:RNAse III [Plasticicumulans acidivorans]
MNGLIDPSVRLSRRLGHAFHDPALLAAALTHRSAGGSNNERLEFLGDALLNCIIGEAVFRLQPHASEGDLSRLRALLVREDTLAELARELDIGECLHLGSGELKSGGYRRASILADAVEALLGAIYLDSDFETCKGVVLALYAQRLDHLPAAAELKDPKTRLQEYRQARQQPLPAYRVIAVAGEAHAQTFTVECACGDLIVMATGSSRRKAEQSAARQALEQLNDD